MVGAAHRRKVLVVDDDESVRSVLQILFDQEGFDPRTAETLPEARAAIASSMPDLLILDITLGAYSGAEILAELAGRRDAPITVIVSGTIAVGELATRYRVPLVSKPFDVEQLMEVVDHALARGTRPARNGLGDS